MTAPKSFKTQEAFRQWLERNHAAEKELILRCFKVHAKDRGIGYREGLDEALSFGWIDGIRRSLDDDSFTVRFTPRKPKSFWSQVNIKRFKELQAEGSVRPAGLAAFEAHDGKPAPYSFQVAPQPLAPEFERQLRGNKKAFEYWNALPPGYKRTVTHWVMMAKREETRAQRFATLLDLCVRQQRLPMMEKYRKPKNPKPR